MPDPNGSNLGNRLLAAIPPEERDRIEPDLVAVDLAYRQDLYERDQAIEHVYFPHGGVVSLINVLPDGASVEFGTVGNEGMAGIAALLGADSMPSKAFAQIPGAASRMAVGPFRAAQRENPAFHALLLRYTQALLNQIAQSAACNRIHPIEERCARWLLMTHDRVGARHFPLTQDFLAQMLGVRRPSVSVAAGMLQRAGMIRYTRGAMTILDRDALEAASCPCYGIVKAEFDRLLA